MGFVIVWDVVHVGRLDFKFAKLYVVLKRLFPGLLIRSIGLIFRVIVTRQIWYICWNVVLVVYNMLAVHVLRLELGVIIINHVIVGFNGGSGFRGTPG